EEALDLVVAQTGLHEPEPREDAPRVRVDHEQRETRGIEDDRIGRFASDAVNGQETLAQAPRILLAHPFHPAPVRLLQEVQERPDAPSLDPIGPGRADERSDARGREGMEALEGKAARPPQSAERPLYVRPGRVLHQDRPETDFERAPTRPPRRVPEAPKQPPVDCQEAPSRWSATPRDPTHDLAFQARY